MKASKELIKSVMGIAQDELTRRGFKESKKESPYTIQLHDDVIGWLGLPRGVNRGDGSLEICVNVGIRHQPLERVVDELRGLKFDPVSPPTLMINVGYLMPEKDALCLEFTPYTDNANLVQQMVWAVMEFGLPWMRSFLTLEAYRD